MRIKIKIIIKKAKKQTNMKVTYHKRNMIVWIDQTGNSIKSINNDGTSETTLTTGKH
jgi:hypothetical protein